MEIVFEDCQLELNEAVARKAKVYEGQESVGTYHHSVIAITKRGSTKSVCYFCEPKFVPVDENGKPSAPPLPTTALASAVMSRHIGNWVVIHTDGAEAYASAIARLADEGFAVLHDYVGPSNGQYSAFGRHDVTDHGAGTTVIWPKLAQPTRGASE